MRIREILREEDRRNKNYITYDIENMLKQRLYTLIGRHGDFDHSKASQQCNVVKV